MANLRILQYNTHLFGDNLGTKIGEIEYQDNHRAQGLGTVLAQANPPYDIVCLEELWSDTEYDTINSYLEGPLQYTSYRPYKSDALKPFGCGLAIFLGPRLKINEQNWCEYTSHAGVDSFTQKGYAWVTCSASRGGNNQDDLLIVWTHSQAGCGEQKCDDAKQADIQQLQRYLAENKQKQTILFGDFNINAEDSSGAQTQQYSQWLNAAMTSQGLQDAFRVLYPVAAKDHGYTVNQTSLSSKFNEKPANERIDYCYIPSDQTAGISVGSCSVNTTDFKYKDADDNMMRDISDHFPLVTVLSIG